jgi:hypothetical protein
MNNFRAHTFHIPVMGTGFTIDTPIRVAPYGISSVISLVDDMLMETMREFYSKKFNLSFTAISSKSFDARAQRITEYLNMVDKIVSDKVANLKQSYLEKEGEMQKYFDMLPDVSTVKADMMKAFQNSRLVKDFNAWKGNLAVGSIDVNIMTKVDKENYSDGIKQSDEFNDAHAALRGFANSTLCSSMVFSAGMNPKLYGYLEQFEDFYPNELGAFRKKITLKVSDYRSALIQGKFLAKKGLWVSEYRVESGLNCGGHAFASDGSLMGPILEEFKNSREELIRSVYELYVNALAEKGRVCPSAPPEVHFTAQGGVGTADEHEFLLNHYNLDSVGWGSPFLLVSEAVSIDDNTKEMLREAKEEDLYLSNISPLGVPFNSLRGNTQDLKKNERIAAGKPGSICHKRYLALNPEFSEKGICTASREYQKQKLEALKSQNLSSEEYDRQAAMVTDKSCLCAGLGTTSLIENNLDTTLLGDGVSVCPGPNMAYFSKFVSLKSMVDHIYGRKNIIERTDRPSMFVKELSIYVELLKSKVANLQKGASDKEMKSLNGIKSNLQKGIAYYRELFATTKEKIQVIKSQVMSDLDKQEKELNSIL